MLVICDQGKNLRPEDRQAACSNDHPAYFARMWCALTKPNLLSEVAGCCLYWHCAMAVQQKTQNGTTLLHLSSWPIGLEFEVEVDTFLLSSLAYNEMGTGSEAKNCTSQNEQHKLCIGQTCREQNKQAKKQTNKRTDKQTNKRTNKQTKKTSKKTNKQTNKPTNRHTHTHTQRHTNTHRVGGRTVRLPTTTIHRQWLGTRMLWKQIETGKKSAVQT